MFVILKCNDFDQLCLRKAFDIVLIALHYMYIVHTVDNKLKSPMATGYIRFSMNSVPDLDISCLTRISTKMYSEILKIIRVIKFILRL